MQQGEKELLQKLLVPLLTKIGWRNHQDAPLSLCPLLGQHETGFDSLTQTNLVCQEGPFRERRSKCKEGSFDLMGIQIDLRVH